MVETGYKVGDLEVGDFDRAMAEGIGALEDPIKKEWYLPLNFYISKDNIHTPIEKALVVFKKSEPTNIDMDLPLIIISRDNIVPVEDRLLSPTVQYKIPAPGAQQVSAGGQLGWTAYETKDKAVPYDFFFFFTIECWSRYRTVAQILLQMIMAKYPLHGKVLVTDSIGNTGYYAVYQQGTADLTQVSSMVDRICGFSLSLRVEGELTSDREATIEPAFTGGGGGGGTGSGGGLSSSPIPGINDNDPYPGPGGLYGTGKVIIRVGVIEDV